MNQVKVLDHGYISLVETWGSDERIIEAARMSTAKGFLGWGNATCADCGEPWESTGAIPHPITPRCPKGRGGGHNIQGEQGDEKLLRFLWQNKHTTPFEMAGAIVEVQAPIFVFREWHRHRTQSYNELSARYTPMPNENYVPSVERCMANSKTNKQAGTVKDAAELTENYATYWLERLAKLYEHAEEVYQLGLAGGVPKELARLPVPVARYSRMRASACLLNWLRFATLRSDMNPGAQWEIRQYGNALVEILDFEFPRTMALFAERKL